MRGLLKEQKSTECKERESTDASGSSSDIQAELRESVETLPCDTQAESHGQSEVIKQPGVSDGKTAVTSEPIVSTTDGMACPQTKGQPHRKSAKQYNARHGVSFVLM